MHSGWGAKLGNQLMFFLFVCDKSIFRKFELLYHWYPTYFISLNLFFSIFSAFWRIKHMLSELTRCKWWKSKVWGMSNSSIGFEICHSWLNSKFIFIFWSLKNIPQRLFDKEQILYSVNGIRRSWSH